jgi:hypothetical protein
MRFLAIEKRARLSREEFKKEYLEPCRPVIFTDLIDDWPAKEKWTFDFFIQQHGDLQVPVYDKSFSKPGKNYMAPTGHMTLRDYLNMIRSGPSDSRIFLFNILAKVPELRNDIRKLTIMDGFINELPFMFFGGQGSYTRIHYDLDCSHVFLTQFQTRKKVMLFAPDQSEILGHLPFTVGCLVDMINPDEAQYPGLKLLTGYEAIINHGETLFIPSMYWHHIEYTEAGYSLALRANNSILQRIKGAYHIARHFMVDRSMNLLLGEKWGDYKKNMALKKQHKKGLA